MPQATDEPARAGRGRKRAARPARPAGSVEQQLREANAQLAAQVTDARDSRRAALNIMEDAVEARQLVETLNVSLRAEVAERKRAEESLRHRTAQYETLINQAPLGVYVVDADFRIRDVNPTARAVFGGIPDLVGRDFDEVLQLLWPRPYADEVVRLFRNTLATGDAYATPERIEHRIDRGRTEYYEWRIDRITLPDGGNGVVCYFRDVSTQVLARAAIAESEERFRTLVSVTTDIAWTTDPAGRFVAPQPAWGSYTGQTWDQLRDFGWIDAVHPDDRSAIRGMWEQARDAQSLYESHGRLWHAASGAYRYFAVRATPVFRSDGSMREWVGACTDIHDRRVAEEALRDTDRRKDEFLAQLAHELRNPLAPIGNAAHLLRFKAPDTPDVRWIRDVIERQVSHLTRLIDDLLDVSRVTRDRLELRKETVALSAVVEAALETVRPVIERYGHELVVTQPPGPVHLHGDVVRLAQVLMNLINNAAKYTAPGGRISLGIDIAHAGDTTVPEVIVSVKDTGVGISSEALPHVFDMFYQADASIERSHGGLGIGLSLARRLVALHGGSIEARSDGPGRGSEFVVRLPILAGAPDTEPLARHDGPESRAVPNRILVVDDNLDAADALANLLRLEGHDVHLAHDGLAAIEAAATFRPDIVLLDIGMPKLNGYEACRRIRDRLPGKRIAMVALTGFGQEQDRHRSQDAGFDAHFVKPVDVGSLMKHIASLSFAQ